MASKAISPNHREILSARSTITGNSEYLLSTNGALVITGSFSLSGTTLPISGATTAVGVAIVDSSGNQISSFGGGTQYADGAVRGTATGTLAMVDDGTNIQSAKADTDGTQQVNTTKIVGTAIDVNSGTKSAGTQRVVLATDQPQLTTAWKVDGSAVTQPVSNGGTFAVQATLAAETTKVIGTVNQGTSPWVVNTASATGATVPANAFYSAYRNTSGNLMGAGSFGFGNGTSKENVMGVGIYIDNGTNADRVSGAINALNSTGTGIVNANNVAQFDDTSPTSITENQFGNLRMSANRNLYNTIRDAAGNERGLNISAGGNITVDAVTAITNALPAGTNAIGKLAANSGVDIGDVDVTSINGFPAEDAALAGNPLRVGVRASYAEPTAMSADGDVVTPWGDRRGRTMVAQKAGTATLSNVSSSATSVTVLAANTSRLGAQVYNDSTQVLYLKFGATASTTSFTVPLAAATYYEVPAGYTGILDGIWASANGSARVTEET